MNDWLDRLRVERSDLNEKVDAIGVFLMGSNYRVLSEKKQDLLMEQRGAMLLYLSILDERLQLETEENE